MYQRKLKYRINGFCNYWFGTSKLESKSEEIFYNLALSQGLILEKQYRFTDNLPFARRVKVWLFPFLHKGFRCDFKFKKFIIEIDSPFHDYFKDLQRDRILNKAGYKVIRIDCNLLYSKEGLKAVKEEITRIVETYKENKFSLSLDAWVKNNV
jgi:hypothetical protein